MTSPDIWLPSYDELTVKQEITLSTPALRAAGVFMNLYCEPKCKEFMLCRREEKDPRKCLGEGKEVTECGVQFLQKIKRHCRSEFDRYTRCIDQYDPKMFTGGCRKYLRPYEQCVFEHFGMERPKITGYFARPHVHATNRPKPNHQRDYTKEANAIVKELPEDATIREDYYRFHENPLKDKWFKPDIWFG